MELGASPKSQGGAEELSGYLTRMEKELWQDLGFRSQSHVGKPHSSTSTRGGSSPECNTFIPKSCHKFTSMRMCVRNVNEFYKTLITSISWHFLQLVMRHGEF